MEKKKIVWICSFANKEIQNIIGNDKSFFASPWITELIELFRNKEDIELSIISPNYYSNDYKFFKLDNIEVHLTQYRRSFIPAKAYNFSINYNTATNAILKVVDTIKPDLIHLHGSENPLYSSPILSLLDKYPVLVTIQGFVSLSSKPKNIISQYIRWNRIRYERLINEKAKHFTVATSDVRKNLANFNKNPIMYNDHYPTTKPEVSSTDFHQKKYDIVYYARISKDKGIEDLIIALKEIKKVNPTISAIIIGGGAESYLNQIKSMIETYGLEDNITFAGFQPTQQDVFKLAAQARVYVLPTHFDGIPGSIREAMFMKIPVVANAVGGIPTLNDESECLTLVEKENIVELTEKILLVLNNKERTQLLVDNAFNLINDKFNNDKIYANLLSIYKDVLASKK
ncbi:glycosyltransferase family 4 protein [uncultured Flavobacterium sp.]|uniref:glycosyltransferase family 4 protein n=1 Tax=uncultured Flavobacterium sp. TaxID=165435 RepID=UPI0030EBC48B|tara:strand:- start:73496 stop:74695 length:1200 start_codon:yes stop_codon:yes gene_type:complete